MNILNIKCQLEFTVQILTLCYQKFFFTPIRLFYTFVPNHIATTNTLVCIQ